MLDIPNVRKIEIRLYLNLFNMLYPIAWRVLWRLILGLWQKVSLEMWKFGFWHATQNVLALIH